MKPMTEKHLAVFRRHMVEVIGVHADLMEEEIGKAALSQRVMEAMLEVPRHHFVVPQLAAVAYHDGPLPIGFDKTVSQPFILALMTDLLDPQPQHSVLEVGTGLGYGAAVLSRLAARVWTVEIVEEFGNQADANLEGLGYGNVTVRVGDGARGWAEHAPFDRIIVTAAAADPPQPLLDQLAPGGRMVLPMGADDEAQILTVLTKDADNLVEAHPVLPVRFGRLETVM